MSLGKPELLNLGFSNLVMANRVVAIVNPASSPMRRLREDARQEGRLIDATQGRKTRSIVITDSNHVILSNIQPDTLRQRFGPGQMGQPGQAGQMGQGSQPGQPGQVGQPGQAGQAEYEGAAE